MRDDLEDIVDQFLAGSEGRKRAEARPHRRVLSLWTKVFVMAVVLVTLASTVLAAVVLFNQSPTYTSAAIMTSGCTAPTGTASGSLITFACGAFAAIYVTSSATGFVTYSAFTQPTNVTAVYAIDAAAALSTSCAASSGPGTWAILLAFTGGQITIGTSTGRLQPGHAYNYCADYGSAPPSFSFTISWSQG